MYVSARDAICASLRRAPAFVMRGTLCTVFGLLATAVCTTASAAQDTSSWRRGSLQLRLPAPDLSFLNHKPAGLHGRVQAKGSDLVFGDGSPARFWGVNLQAYALFATDPGNIPLHAKRLASLGVNLVRLHHHDFGLGEPERFRSGFRHLPTAR